MERTLNRRYVQSECIYLNIVFSILSLTVEFKPQIHTTNTYASQKKYLLFILMDMDELVTLKLVWSNTQNISPTSL